MADHEEQQTTFRLPNSALVDARVDEKGQLQSLLRLFLLRKESAKKEYFREMDEIEPRYCRINSRYKRASHHFCSVGLEAM
jgi:hypothetical protein